MWFWIWTALALGALGVAALCARDLWQKFLALGRETSTSTERLAAPFGEVAERIDVAVAAQPSTASFLAGGPTARDGLQRRVNQLRDERWQRKLHRRRPRPEVYQRWLSVWR